MQFTSAELNVMTILWNAAPSPLSRDEICNSTAKSSDWKASTFYVIMKGLEAKKAVREVRRFGRRFCPTISCEEYYAQLMASSPCKIDFEKLQQAYLGEEAY